MNMGRQWNKKMKMANDYCFLAYACFTSFLFFTFQFLSNEAEKQEHFEFQHKSSNNH